MKLIGKGDDFGFTRGVTDGIVDSIDRGLLRNTGLFTNMPATEYAVSFMKDREHIACFGIDFNIVSGRPVSDPATVPHLVDENGEFIRSGKRLKDPRYDSEEGRREMFPYDEVYRELKAQYDRFVELVGHKPGYLNGHSLTHEHYREAMAQISRESGIPISNDLHAKYGFFDCRAVRKPGEKPKKVFDPIAQLEKDPLGRIMGMSEEILKSDYAIIGGHPGYIDAELLTLTTLSLERCKDAAMWMSEEMAKWVKDNNIELIRYTDLY